MTNSTSTTLGGHGALQIEHICKSISYCTHLYIHGSVSHEKKESIIYNKDMGYQNQ